MKKMFVIFYVLTLISIQSSLFVMLTGNGFSENEISIIEYNHKLHDDPDVIYKRPDILVKSYYSIYTLNSAKDFDGFVDYINKYGYQFEKKDTLRFAAWFPFAKQMQILLLRGNLDNSLVYSKAYSGQEIILIPCYGSNKWIIVL